MVKVYSLDQLNQVFQIIVIFPNLDLNKVSFEGFPPLSATLASGVKYNTLPCRSSPQPPILSKLKTFRVSPAPAPRSILVKKVTFQRREGESSSGSRFFPLVQILLKSPQFFSVGAALVQASQVTSTWRA